MKKIWVIALLASFVFFVSGPTTVPAQNPQAPAQQSQPAAAGSQPASSSSAPTDPATKEILGAVRGYGDKLTIPVLKKPGDRYRVEIGDQVNVYFTILKAIDETVAVMPDGHISLIGTHDIYVEHMTLPEVNEAIKKAYAGLFAPPILVDATITNMEKPYFVVGGQVTNPGKFVLHGSFTVTEAIEAAGGFLLNTAKHSQVLLFRRTSDNWVECRLVNVKRILDRGELQNDVQLQSGDLVFVPKNFLSKLEPYISYFMVYNLFNINYGTNVNLAGD
jgi:polysaccharide biosynthesis/export protein